MKNIRVLIADDHAIVRHGLCALLGTERGIEVVGEAKDGNEAVARTKQLAPDVVIMDIVMPRKDGVEATAEIRAAVPSAKIVVLTSFGTSDKISRAIEAGATGALMKTAEDRELISAIRTVASGGRVISPAVRKLISTDPPAPELTPRQLEILQAMARGLTNKDIAKMFSIRTDGVNEHVLAILAKLGAANRTEAVATAIRKQLIRL
ncbi:MAG: response regulator transcription factor [Kiritimatiellae bacterium]|nr:response regulator transcription factor [Kiritimatiellia bacterium]MBR0241504.1 response regulator transcription factor [Kiritimatiellia bacterium]